MKTAREFVGNHWKPCTHGFIDVTPCYACRAELCEAYHAECCREALAGEGPVSGERLEELRVYLKPAMPANSIAGDLFTHIDHLAARCVALEGLLEDAYLDGGVERGRQMERVEIVEEIINLWERMGTKVESVALERAVEAIHARGPGPGPVSLPADRARARVKALEAALREIVEATGRSFGRDPDGSMHMRYESGDNIPWKIAREALGEKP